jgi:Effector-associated domain 7
MSYSTADIRKFLIDVFSDEDLEIFCFDHFPEVANDFGTGMGKAEKVQRLIEYCQRRELIPTLLAALQAARPEQYQQHLGELVRATPAQPVPAPPAPERRTLLMAVGGLAGLLLVALAVTLLLRGANQGATPALTPTVPSPTAPSTPTVMPSVTPVPPPTAVPTEVPPPDFTTLNALHIGEHMETQVQPGADYTEATHLLELREVTFVQLGDNQYGYRVLLAVRNATTDTIRLALKPDYFGLEDEQGRTARLAYFCCAKPVDLLAPGQAREVLLFFEDNQRWGSGGKGGPDHLYMVVKGLLPVVRTSWLIRLLATAD